MKAEQKTKGLFQNGARWWLRIQHRRLTTGTAELKVANRIAGMVHMMETERVNRDLLVAVLSDRTSLLDLYDAYATGTLDTLRATIAHAAIVDPDVEPYVERWDREHLAGKSIAAHTRLDYVRLTRALVPEGVALPASKLTEDKVKSALLALPVSDSTKRRYASAWQLFLKYLRRRVATVRDPFEFADEWMPRNGTSRTTFWTHRQTLSVLDRMSGDTRRAMALIFGTGMELGALRNLRWEHIQPNRVLVAPGTKNAHRRDRTILCDAWAWAIFTSVPRGFPLEPVFLFADAELRNAFYTAQVDAGVIAKPARSASGKLLWHGVNAHRIHDARHTFAINRLLGLDDEPKRTAKFISQQLGHADETMLSRVYAKANVEARHDLALQEMEMDPVRLEIAR